MFLRHLQSAQHPLINTTQTQLKVLHRGTNTPVVSVTGLNVASYSTLVVKFPCFLALYVLFGKGRVLREYLGAVFGYMYSFVSLIDVSSLDLLQLCVCLCYMV